MKILYGIQGTGNGHISRARMLARHFSNSNIEVTYLLSGRSRDKFFDMDAFGDFSCLRGLTFYSENGRVNYPKTAIKNNIFRFAADMLALDVSAYDLIISDFEPISAWAGKLRGVKVIGLGHQYAFGHNIPRAGANLIASNVMRFFAPASFPLGLHWHHFGNPILPPIIDTDIKRVGSTAKDAAIATNKKSIVIYLPFENQQSVQALVSPLKDFQFTIYSPELKDEDHGHIALRKTSLHGFKRDLESSQGVICNSGFELISECLYLGLPVLSKPQGGQMEQLSNAEALKTLAYATTTNQLDTLNIQQWLNNLSTPIILRFPDVAKRVVEWLSTGQQETASELSQTLWAQVEKTKEK